ncbi:hypothetical protein TNCT_2531 [Trichonephila clavata]|uniref:Uncharacterized protein n=1 Tax=Trichonephila clavata TaxID=2740835 RepID=A0A8X6IZE2_TRICU|nr:hypothetical protein TNCT_2531 [Trichonephila clavata]
MGASDYRVWAGESPRASNQPVHPKPKWSVAKDVRSSRQRRQWEEIRSGEGAAGLMIHRLIILSPYVGSTNWNIENGEDEIPSGENAEGKLTLFWEKISGVGSEFQQGDRHTEAASGHGRSRVLDDENTRPQNCTDKKEMSGEKINIALINSELSSMLPISIESANNFERH